MSATPTAVTNRFSLFRDPQPAKVASFADDVRAGLSTTPKRLAPKYFYDDLGSSLFEAITRLPEYYLTRIERDLLFGYSGEIVDALGTPLELLELGSGSAVKTRTLIGAILERQRRLVFRPIDISPEALIESSQALVAAHDALAVEAYASDYFTLLRNVQFETRDRILALFLGSNIGNFEPRDAQALLRLLAGALRRDDALLIGYDLKKEPEILELAYDDPTGVTAAFNRNLLARINRELGGNFDVRAFDHVASYDPERGSVDSYLQTSRAADVEIRALDMTVHFEPGERIHTESSYKFTPDEIAAAAASCGFTTMRSWTDTAQRYALTLFKRT